VRGGFWSAPHAGYGPIYLIFLVLGTVRRYRETVEIIDPGPQNERGADGRANTAPQGV